MATIRAVRDGDYAGIARLRRHTIRHVNVKDYPQDVIDEWSAKVSAQALRESAVGCKRWVALDGKAIVGFCEHSLGCELSRLYVHKDYLRKAIGSRLLAVAEQSLARQGCTRVKLESTVTAKDFYLAKGYRVMEKMACGEQVDALAYTMNKII